MSNKAELKKFIFSIFVYAFPIFWIMCTISHSEDQKVWLEASNTFPSVGESITINVLYEVDSGRKDQTGLAFRIHFDSSSLEYIEFSNFFQTKKLCDPSYQNELVEQTDYDSKTDKIIVFAYADISLSGWPQDNYLEYIDNLPKLVIVEYPLILAKLVFKVKSAYGSDLNVTLTTNDPAYGFIGNGLKINKSIESPKTPIINIISPTSGSTGTPVTISGSNFQANPMVSFAGIPASNIIQKSSNTITCNAPSYSLSKTVEVLVTNPGNITPASISFTYINPAIKGVFNYNGFQEGTFRMNAYKVEDIDVDNIDVNNIFNSVSGKKCAFYTENVEPLNDNIYIFKSFYVENGDYLIIAYKNSAIGTNDLEAWEPVGIYTSTVHISCTDSCVNELDGMIIIEDPDDRNENQYINPLSTYAKWANNFTFVTNEYKGAYEDADHDGYSNFMEYFNGTDPLIINLPYKYAGYEPFTDLIKDNNNDHYQIIFTNPSAPVVYTNGYFVMDIMYDNYDEDKIQNKSLSGLGIAIHFDSTKIAFSGFSNVLTETMVGTNIPYPLISLPSDPNSYSWYNDIPDENDSFNDNYYNTTKYIPIAWMAQDVPMEWPGQDISLPLRLCSLTFKAIAEFKNTVVNITPTSTDPRCKFYASPVTVNTCDFSLDIDANGKVDALTDGILIMRYLYGLMYGGQLIQVDEISSGATRKTPNDLFYFLDNNLKFLDIDGNCYSDALTDGLLIVRYMMGLNGNSLVENAIYVGPPVAKRTSPEEIIAYIKQLIPRTSINNIVNKKLPCQILKLSPSDYITQPGQNITLNVHYDVSNGDNTLSGLAVNFHYDSTKLELDSFTFNKLLIGEPTEITESNKYGGQDRDSNTDRILVVGWIDWLNNKWPDQDLPMEIGKLNFFVKDSFIDDETNVNISFNSNANGYGVRASNAIIRTNSKPTNCKPIILQFLIKDMITQHSNLTNSRTVKIELDTVEDCEAIIKWLITETSDKPDIEQMNSGSDTAINNYTIQSNEDGNKKLYAWVMDRSNNISNYLSAEILLDTQTYLEIETKRTCFTSNSISLTGIIEKNATISLNSDTEIISQITYPTDTSWKADITELSNGNNIINISATDKAGNTISDTINIRKSIPFIAEFTNGNDSILADGSGIVQLDINIKDVLNESLCDETDIQVISDLGTISPGLYKTINGSINCQFKAGFELGTANISVFYDDKLLGTKNIELIAGEIDKLVLKTDDLFQELNMPGNFIKLQVQDAYEHPLPATENIQILLTSDAGINGEFYICQNLNWTWHKGELIHFLTQGNNEFIFKFKTSKPGNITITASEIYNNLKQTNLNIQVGLIIPEIEFNVAHSEGNENESPVNIELILSHDFYQDISIGYQQIFDDNSEYNTATADLDYKFSGKILTIKAGELNGFLTINTIDDDIYELQEAVIIELMNPVNAILGQKKIHTFVINDNDKRGILISESDEIPIIIENSDPYSFTIALRSRPKYDVEIQFEYDNQKDYENQWLIINPENIFFNADEWNIHKNVYISAPDDNIFKGNVDINISLNVKSDDTNYNSLDTAMIVHIQDDDPKPVPPEITGPDSPHNSNIIEWCWSSGGGTGKYRYKIDDASLDVGAGETMNTCYKPHSNLTEGNHIFYVQEYNEYTNQWSNAAIYNIEIDTGLPCSFVSTPSSVNAQNMNFEILYEFGDVYKGEACGNINSGSKLKRVELWAAGPGDIKYYLADTDSSDNIDGKFEFAVTNEGRYRFLSRAIDNANNIEEYPLPIPDEEYDSETIYAKNFSGYAILAVGTVTDKEGLDSHTLTADNIYKHLINRHFGIDGDMQDPLDHIKFYNPNRDTHTGVDRFDTDNAGRPLSYKNSLERAIKVWALNKMSNISGPLFIILIDHGAPDNFYLSDNSETLKSHELDTWITNLENGINENNIEKNDIIIVVGTCYSGSFIDELSGTGRIIISSSTTNEVSFRGPKNPGNGNVRDGAFFTNNLFNELSKGMNLAQAFEKAVQSTEIMTISYEIKRQHPFYDNSAQHPLLDDNGDGIGNNTLYYSGDGYYAKNIIFGNGLENSESVEIIQTSISCDKLEENENSIEFKVNVSNIERVEKVWVEIRMPGSNLPDVENFFRQNELDLEEKFLSFDQSGNLYKGTYNLFNDPGKYTIFFYVKDKDSIISNFNESYVYKSKKGNRAPEIFELMAPVNLNDPENFYIDETELTHVILKWENTKDTDKDEIFYRLYLSKNQSFQSETLIIKDQIVDTQFLIDLPESWDDSDVYWKVRAMDNFGEYFETETWKFHTDNKNAPGDLPIVFVQVYDPKTNIPVPNALVSFKLDDSLINFQTNEMGRSIERLLNKGIFDVTISAKGYYSSIEKINIQADSGISLNFPLIFNIQKGDIDRNGSIDIKDSILSLQILSMMSDLEFYYDEGALTSDVLTVGDAIFILGKISKFIE